jgi:hypothetical protein
VGGQEWVSAGGAEKSRLVGRMLTKAEWVGIVKTVKTTPLVTLADES